MRPKEAQRLHALMQAKTQVEQYAYAATRSERDALLSNAAALRRRAAMQNKQDEESAALLRLQAMQAGKLLEKARSLSEDAAALSASVEARRKFLERALQRELALGKLVEAQEAEARKTRNDHDEGQQEIARMIQSLQSASR
ncbi:MAG: hypothetical protein ACX939_07555 [Hyphococcus sp.]